MQQWYSQIGQDRFVWLALNAKQRGTFADIGAGEPERISNTVALERDFGWHGILCDIDHASRLRRERSKRNKVFGDAFGVDWRQELKRLARKGWIDYLSLDLEPADLAVDLLMKLPLGEVKFRVATVEHDEYRDSRGPLRSALMHDVMAWHGYLGIVQANVRDDRTGNSGYMEDWYVHADAGFDVDRLRKEFQAAQAAQPIVNR